MNLSNFLQLITAKAVLNIHFFHSLTRKIGDGIGDGDGGANSLSST
jgi:hypothetical protein